MSLMSSECTHLVAPPTPEGKCPMCGEAVLKVRQLPANVFDSRSAARNLMAAMSPDSKQGDDAERLPRDAYAAQGGKAAVNELLAMKMQQCANLNKKIGYIRDLVSPYVESPEHMSEMHKGEKRMALMVLDILNKADGYDD
jgi:hypothetical protein